MYFYLNAIFLGITSQILRNFLKFIIYLSQLKSINLIILPDVIHNRWETPSILCSQIYEGRNDLKQRFPDWK